MGNELLNATGLDGTADWTAGGALSVLNAGAGAHGRLVFRSAAGFIRSAARPLNGAPSVVAFGHIKPGGGQVLQVRFLDGGGALISTADVPVLRLAVGPATRGRPNTFSFAKGVIPAPGGAVSYQLNATGSGETLLLRPYASTDGVADVCWQPGPHSNPDLNYPAWPASLPSVRDEGYQAEPVATRKGFSGDSGIEATRRVTKSRRYRLSAELALTTAERDVLMDFFDTVGGTFWYSRPDTREVCLAQWLADGEPVDAGILPGRRRTQIKLQLKVP